MDELAPTQMTTTFLCKTGDVPEKGILRVVVSGYPSLAIYHLDGEFYATDNRCSHGNASLAAGHIEDGVVVCPLHFGSFNIKTGQPVDPPCLRPIGTYDLIQQGDDLLLSDPQK